MRHRALEISPKILRRIGLRQMPSISWHLPTSCCIPKTKLPIRSRKSPIAKKRHEPSCNRRINTGVYEHRWNDAQLQQLQAKLEKIEVISELKLGLEAEFKMHGVALEDLKGRYNRLKVVKHWASMFGSGVTESRNPVAEFLFW